MRGRYQGLTEKETYEAFNRLRDVFLAARNGEEVDKVINGVLTHDEKLKIGRRILIAEYLVSGYSIDDIRSLLKVGKNTVMHVKSRLEKYKESFELIERRRDLVEREYERKKHRLIGGSMTVFKRKEYTGFKRKDVKRGRSGV